MWKLPATVGVETQSEGQENLLEFMVSLGNKVDLSDLECDMVGP